MQTITFCSSPAGFVLHENSLRLRSVERRSSVDFEDAKNVIGHRVEAEGRARLGLEFCAPLQPQEARHLAGLHEVEGVRPRGGRGPVALHALQLLGPGPVGHHVQLHILRLLFIEQHLRRAERRRVH